MDGWANNPVILILVPPEDLEQVGQEKDDFEKENIQQQEQACQSQEDMSRKFERYFFVDFENVHSCGMEGVASLTERDCVKLYYNDANISLTFALHHQIVSSKARFEFFEVKVPIKNAVDCQILFHLRDMVQKNLAQIKEASFFVVSKDSDYDAAILEYQNQGVNIERRESILVANTAICSPSTDTLPCTVPNKAQKNRTIIGDKVDISR